MVVPEDRYDLSFLQRLKDMGVEIKVIDGSEVASLRGTVAAVTIAPDGLKETVETQGVLLFAATF